LVEFYLTKEHGKAGDGSLNFQESPDPRIRIFLGGMST